MQEHEEEQAALMHRRKNKSRQRENNRSGAIDQFLEFACFFQEKNISSRQLKGIRLYFQFSSLKIAWIYHYLVSILAPDRKKKWSAQNSNRQRDETAHFLGLPCKAP